MPEDKDIIEKEIDSGYSVYKLGSSSELSNSLREDKYNSLYVPKKYIDTLNILPNLDVKEATKNSRSEINPMTQIVKHGSPNPNIDYMVNGYEYIFMTKPLLNIEDNIAHDGFLKFLNTNHPETLKCLSYARGGGAFIPFATNLYEKFDIDDIVLNDTTEAESWRGFGQKLPTHSTDSVSGGTFTITYQELQTPLVTYVHKAWVDYIEGIRFGFLAPSMTSIQSKTLDFTCSLYYFLLEPDGETIRLWAKYTGVTPKNIPYSGFSGEKGSPNLVKVAVQYLYSYREVLDPINLVEFNKVTAGTGVASTKNTKKDRDPVNAAGNIDHDKNTPLTAEEELELKKNGEGGDLKMILEEETYQSVSVGTKGNKYKLIFKN